VICYIPITFVYWSDLGFFLILVHWMETRLSCELYRLLNNDYRLREFEKTCLNWFNLSARKDVLEIINELPA